MGLNEHIFVYFNELFMCAGPFSLAIKSEMLSNVSNKERPIMLPRFGILRDCLLMAAKSFFLKMTFKTYLPSAFFFLMITQA
jgi:hypothetical protein